MSKAIYVAGPMSGIPEFNFPAFFAAEEKLRTLGWTVYNPAKKEHEGPLIASGSFATGDTDLADNSTGFDFKATYLWDMEHVIYSDAIYMLKGWEKGAGARGEHAVALVMKRHNPEYGIYYEECSVPNRQPEERENSEASPTPSGREPSYGGL